FLELVTEVVPDQCTLVPDPPDAITSNTGWDTIKNQESLKEIIARLHKKGIRVSIFLNADPNLIDSAQSTGADRIELYTGPYAENFRKIKEDLSYRQSHFEATYVATAKAAFNTGLEINAGHDLNLKNLSFLKRAIPKLAETSIGHALICDALYYGLENTIQLYKRQLTAY